MNDRALMLELRERAIMVRARIDASKASVGYHLANDDDRALLLETVIAALERIAVLEDRAEETAGVAAENARLSHEVESLRFRLDEQRTEIARLRSLTSGLGRCK